MKTTIYCNPCDDHILQVSTQILDPDEIINRCCEFLKLKRENVVSKYRDKPYVYARMMIADMLFNDKYLNLTNKAVGYYLGKRDHSTILNAKLVLKDLLEYDEVLRDKYIKLYLHVYHTTKYFIH